MANYIVTSDGRKDLGKYPENVRDVAFELWAFQCSRDPKQVARLLAEDAGWRERAGLGEGDIAPSDDSIRRWAVAEEWSDLAYERMAEAMPHSLAKGSVELIYSFTDAVRTLTRVAANRGSGENGQVSSGDRIAADNAFRIVNLIVGDQVSQLAKPVVDKAIDLSQINEMSMESLQELERGMTSRAIGSG
jgi:nuclear transport factor 2 (NTF2) superfamily protein